MNITLELLTKALKESKPEKVNGFDSGYYNQLLRWNVVVESLKYELVKAGMSDNDSTSFLRECGYIE